MNCFVFVIKPRFFCTEDGKVNAWKIHFWQLITFKKCQQGFSLACVHHWTLVTVIVTFSCVQPNNADLMYSHGLLRNTKAPILWDSLSNHSQEVRIRSDDGASSCMSLYHKATTPRSSRQSQSGRWPLTSGTEGSGRGLMEYFRSNSHDLHVLRGH